MGSLRLGFEVSGLGFAVFGPGFEDLGLGFEVLRLGFEVLGLGFQVSEPFGLEASWARFGHYGTPWAWFLSQLLPNIAK